MAFDVSQISDYAWADIQKAAKHAMMKSALGAAMFTINGKTFQHITIDEATKLYQLATEMVALEGGGTSGDGNVLVRLNPSS